MVQTESLWRGKRIEILAEKLGYTGMCVSVKDGRWEGLWYFLSRERVKRDTEPPAR